VSRVGSGASARATLARAAGFGFAAGLGFAAAGAISIGAIVISPSDCSTSAAATSGSGSGARRSAVEAAGCLADAERLDCRRQDQDSAPLARLAGPPPVECIHPTGSMERITIPQRDRKQVGCCMVGPRSAAGVHCKAGSALTCTHHGHRCSGLHSPALSRERSEAAPPTGRR
jgi:hypothetical protein